jgi:hypothetical protein
MAKGLYVDRMYCKSSADSADDIIWLSSESVTLNHLGAG